MYLTKDGTEIEATVVNYSNNEAPLEECIVAKVYVEALEEGDNSVLLVLRKRSLFLNYREQGLKAKKTMAMCFIM